MRTSHRARGDPAVLRPFANVHARVRGGPGGGWGAEADGPGAGYWTSFRSGGFGWISNGETSTSTSAAVASSSATTTESSESSPKSSTSSHPHSSSEASSEPSTFGLLKSGFAHSPSLRCHRLINRFESCWDIRLFKQGHDGTVHDKRGRRTRVTIFVELNQLSDARKSSYSVLGCLDTVSFQFRSWHCCSRCNSVQHVRLEWHIASDNCFNRGLSTTTHSRPGAIWFPLASSQEAPTIVRSSCHSRVRDAAPIHGAHGRFAVTVATILRHDYGQPRRTSDGRWQGRIAGRVASPSTHLDQQSPDCRIRASTRTRAHEPAQHHVVCRSGRQ